MKPFIHDDFMLQNKVAKKLYHEYAAGMPIFDFHCHLSPQEISDNHQFSTISEIWLHGDHYKWRAMRTLGIDEQYVTGSASDEEKFQQWSKTVPHTIGNPLYHWTHLELKRYFGIDELLNEQTSKRIWEATNEQLQQPELTTQSIIEKSNVRGICTTDDPTDTLEYHKQIALNQDIKTAVLPTFRPDKAIEIQQDGFQSYIQKLGESADISIQRYDDVLKALERRMDAFAEVGCVVSDHGLQTLPFESVTKEEADRIFEQRMSGEHVTEKEIEKYRTYTMVFLGKQYHRRGWVMQLHLGAIRNNNKRMFHKLGPDKGFDSMYDFDMASSLNGFFNKLDSTDQLPKTIVYNLNPIHNEVIATTIGNFQSSDARGKLQFGSGWWFNDQKVGMVRQMTDLANHGLLSTFVGMLTDSRSFLSYTRHEYFRRILCNVIGEWVELGEAPEDYTLLGKMIEDICFRNANQFFGVELER
ncbi:glucuronate isomerase [Halalkalibacter hemicellulosilyticus]|uniref:Uronate isomerase n=1 Tax=Halalkalibacter hemicellulosilyticusJCM 9152 TaxID=1236971 RepID=W4QJI8_9BACI|nr:glucuronate isomerase [Halalkalibacter hemicellulosilyticus]GAE32077.1 uronate isomerase [Halalkalibacter hemicellulosilyticusJCM 9152]